MTEYAFIENDIITGPFGQLPTSWRNVSHLALHDDLPSLGWYPVVEQPLPVFDPLVETLSWSLSFATDHVVKSWTVVAMTPEQIADANPVPQSVTPLQMRKALRQIGLKAAVDEYVALLDEEAREEWDFCSEIRRDHAVLNAGAAALGKSEAEVDDLFRLAATY